MSRPQPRHLGRILASTIGLPALLLGSLTASAFPGASTAGTTPATGPHVVKHAVEDDMCDPIRFGTNPANAAAAAATAAKAAKAVRFPTRFELPAGFQPEGIAIDRSGTAYFGSRVDGDIYAASLRTGAGKVISQGPGTASLGMKTDKRGRLFVAGAAGGNGRVIDTRSGKVLASYTFTTATPTFVNDVILSKDAAWFTDSRQPVLYKVPLGRNGKLPSQAAVQTIKLSGDYVHDPANNNANGIELTPDGRNLIIVQSATGFLFRVDPRTGVTRKIDLGAAVMTNGDGLLLSKDTLYVVQNRLNKIAVLDLDNSGSRGRLVREITSTDFDVPTTAAFYGSRIYLPNARFSTPPTPATEYWVTAVKR
ncbi:superoxide dismutase [Kribbella sp. NPDC056861]|uniref:SMP-30/gluconolactonase/LRE family protein n=1 Tax=Kribbella sp. NPDC056861 TaxID=3154857 RepID=UPI00342FF862